MPVRFLPSFARLATALASLLTTVLAAATSENHAANCPRPPEVFIQSHRGAGVLAAENTIEAFELGWQLGTCPECDVRTTKDGVIVTFHDANFSRVVREADEKLAQLGVKDLTFAELQQLDVGTWQGRVFESRRVCRLRDALAAMRDRPKRRLTLDIKQVDLPQLAEEVKTAGVERRIIFASPNVATLRAWHQLVPESDTLLWLRGSERTLRTRLTELRTAGFDGVRQIQFHLFLTATLDQALVLATAKAESVLDTSLADARRSPHRFTLSDDFIRQTADELRTRGLLLQALPYTDDPAVYGQLLDLGVTSFSTDHPDIALRETKAHRAALISAPIPR